MSEGRAAVHKQFIGRQIDSLYRETRHVHKRAMELAMRGDSEEIARKVAQNALTQAALFKELRKLGEKLNES